MRATVQGTAVAARISRRALVVAPCALLGSLLLPQHAFAGAQIEEPLADAVRNALSAAIANQAPPEPIFRDTETRLAHLRWLAAMSDRLLTKKAELQIRKEFLQTVWYESRRAGLDTALVLGLIQEIGRAHV